MALRKYGTLLGLSLCLCACDDFQPAKSQPLPSAGKPIALGRFVPLPEYPGNPSINTVPRPFLALDTVTGSLCRTWDFVEHDPSDVLHQIQNLPLCRHLYIATNNYGDTARETVEIKPTEREGDLSINEITTKSGKTLRIGEIWINGKPITGFDKDSNVYTKP